VDLAARSRRSRFSDGRAICSSARILDLAGNLVSSTIPRHALSGFNRLNVSSSLRLAPAYLSGKMEQVAPLFSPEEAKDFRARCDAIQVSFVDEPRRAVEQADTLVAGAMKRLAEMFATERANLEGQWDSGDNVSTEDLRIALRRYRSFFCRLLPV
jgi:hypothetical protein